MRQRLCLLLLILGMAPMLRASTIVPPRDLDDLARRSDAVVVARAGDSVTERHGGLLWTRTAFAADETLLGPQGAFEVVAPGGERDGVGWAVAGAPRFAPGTRYLLFLDARGDGAFQPQVLAWGLFREARGADGEPYFVPVDEARQLGTLPRADGQAGEPLTVHHAGRLIARLEIALAGAGLPIDSRASAEITAALTPDSIPGGCAFMTSGNPIRWSVFDGGGSTSIHADNDGDTSLAGGGYGEIGNALGMWMGIASTSINVSYAGTQNVSLGCSGSPSDMTPGLIFFNDPCSDIADLSGCSGTLAFGGPWFGGTHTFDGQTWWTATDWSVVVNNGSGCLGSSNYSIMMAHELGHGLGFGHVSDGGALMNAFCCNAINATDTMCAQYVYPGAGSGTPPTANFSFAPVSPVTGQSVAFTDTSIGGPTSWSWSFGDGATSTQHNPSHAYGAPGTYSVTLTATNSSGSDPETKSVTVTQAPPVASFNYSPSSPKVGQTVSFTDTSSGSPTSWSWDFGDGATATSQNPTHAFAAAGVYSVTLFATNTVSSDSVSKNVTVTVNAPSADFSFTPTSPQTNQNVFFTDLSTGSPANWSWTFGDGTSSTLQHPTKSYASAGTFFVSLLVSNAGGSNSTTKSITVTAAPTAPTAGFAWSPNPGVVGSPVQFTDASTGAPTTWLWDFGDGALPSPAQNPSHTYTSAGTYTVRLTATNANGSDFEEKSVVVQPASSAPAAAFTFSPSAPKVGDSVSFTDSSSGSPTSWTWNFGDGSSSSSQHPAHVYAAAGSYSVALTATNASGSSTATKTVAVTAASSSPTAAFDVKTATGATVLPGGSLTRGASYSFVDRSTAGSGGTLSGWSWSFGDGASGSGASATHAYTTTATAVTVSLTVMQSDGKSATASATFTLQDQPGPEAPDGFVVAAAAHAAGVGSAFWQTRLVAMNPSRTTSMSLSGRLFRSGFDNTGAISADLATSIPPGGAVRLEDLLANTALNPAAAASGAIWLEPNAEPFDHRWPIITSVTYTSDPADPAKGAYGQMIPARTAWPSTARAATGSSYIEGLRADGTFRSNVGVVNLASAPSGASFELRAGSDGRLLAAHEVSLPGYGHSQFAIDARNFSGFDPASAFASNLYVVVRPDVGAAVTAYASVIDNATNDPSYVAARDEGASQQTVAGVARAPGVAGTVWRSDLHLLNPGSSSVDVELTLRFIVDGQVRIARRTRTLAAGAQAIFADVVGGGLFGIEDSLSGSVLVRGLSSAKVIASARTYNQAASGTFGQWVAGATSELELGTGSGHADAYLVGLDVSAATRTNIGAVHTGGSTEARVFLELLTANGDVLASQVLLTIPTGGFTQASLPSTFGLDANVTFSGPVTVRATSDSASTAIVYASVVDNVTGDPVFVHAVVP